MEPAKPIEWDALFLIQAQTIALRSKDPSTRCGAVLVGTDRVVLSQGFNGPPKEMVDNEIPWTQRPEKYSYILHAEENALWYAVGGHGFDRIKGSTMYVTHAPCADCVLRLIRCGVGKVVLPKDTPDYPMSKYQAKPEDVLGCQTYPKLNIVRV